MVGIQQLKIQYETFQNWVPRESTRQTQNGILIEWCVKLANGLVTKTESPQPPTAAETRVGRDFKFGPEQKTAAIHNKQVRLVNPSTFEESYQGLPMIFPHQFCLALWRCGEEVFRRCLFGRFTEKEVEAFWDHIEMKCEWFDGHPAASWTTRSRLVSIGTYGDKYKPTETPTVDQLQWLLGLLSWPTWILQCYDTFQ